LEGERLPEPVPFDPDWFANISVEGEMAKKRGLSCVRAFIPTGMEEENSVDGQSRSLSCGGADLGFRSYLTTPQATLSRPFGAGTS